MNFWTGVAPTFNLDLQEAEAGGSPGLHRQTLSQKQTDKHTNKKVNVLNYIINDWI